jgi:hypothetical protein
MSNIVQETSYMCGGQGPKGLQSHGKEKNISKLLMIVYKLQRYLTSDETKSKQS